MLLLTCLDVDMMIGDVDVFQVVKFSGFISVILSTPLLYYHSLYQILWPPPETAMSICLFFRLFVRLFVFWLVVCSFVCCMKRNGRGAAAIKGVPYVFSPL